MLLEPNQYSAVNVASATSQIRLSRGASQIAAGEEKQKAIQRLLWIASCSPECDDA